MNKLQNSVKDCFPRRNRKISKTSYDRCYLRDKIWWHIASTREKRSAHACLPCFRRIFAIEIIRDNKLDSGREIQKSKLHTQKISLEFHEHKVY